MKQNQNSVSIDILKSLEPKIKELTQFPDIWNSLDIDYYPPRVERLFTDYEDYRIYLHYIHPTDTACLFHKHRWPAAFKQVAGSYEMGITYSENEVTSEQASNMPVLAKFIISINSYYEMLQTDCLHYVRPLGDVSASIMITKDKYPEAEFRKEALDKKLKSFTELRKLTLLQYFNKTI